MGTFVAPMGSAAVAIPAASRWSDRFAALVFVARLNMSGGGKSRKRRSQRREEDQVVSGKIRGGLTNLSQVIGSGPRRSLRPNSSAPPANPLRQSQSRPSHSSALPQGHNRTSSPIPNVHHVQCPHPHPRKQPSTAAPSF